MSLVSDFANAAFTASSAVIGTQTIAISGGTAVACVVNEVRHAREFEDGGFAPDAALDCVCRRSVFVAAYTGAAGTYIGNTAVVGGSTYRVQSISYGSSHVAVSVVHQQDAT